MLYKAYRLGMLPWKSEPNLRPREFVVEAEDFIMAHYQFGWSVKKGVDPVLNVYGVDLGEFVMVGDVVWAPKTSARQKIESGIVLFEGLRDQFALLLHSGLHYKKFFERFCDYKLLRRVGTVFPLTGERQVAYQTRAG